MNFEKIRQFRHVRPYNGGQPARVAVVFFEGEAEVWEILQEGSSFAAVANILKEIHEYYGRDDIPVGIYQGDVFQP